MDHIQRYVHGEHAARALVASVCRFVSLMETIGSAVVVQTGPYECLQNDTQGRVQFRCPKVAHVWCKKEDSEG